MADTPLSRLWCRDEILAIYDDGETLNWWLIFGKKKTRECWIVSFLHPARWSPVVVWSSSRRVQTPTGDNFVLWHTVSQNDAISIQLSVSANMKFTIAGRSRSSLILTIETCWSEDHSSSEISVGNSCRFLLNPIWVSLALLQFLWYIIYYTKHEISRVHA